MQGINIRTDFLLLEQMLHSIPLCCFYIETLKKMFCLKQAGPIYNPK